MTVFYNTFGADTIGAAPSNFTTLQNWTRKTPPATFAVATDPNNRISGKLLNVNDNTFDGPGITAFTTPGKNADVDFIATLNMGYGFSSQVTLALNASDTSNTAHIIRLSHNGGAGIITAGALYASGTGYLYVDDTGNTASKPSTVPYNATFNVRVNKTGNNIKVKLWVFGTAEPTTWLIDVTNATNILTTAGYVGIYHDKPGGSFAGYPATYYYFSVGTAGEAAITPPILIKGDASHTYNGQGKLTNYRFLKGAAQFAFNGNLVTYTPIGLKGDATAQISTAGNARVNNRLSGSATIQIQVAATQETTKDMAGDSGITFAATGRMANNKGIKGGISLVVDNTARLHGGKVRFVNGGKINLATNATGRMANKFVIKGKANPQVDAAANLGINRFISPFPPQLFIFNNDRLDCILGKGKTACPYYNPVHVEQIFNGDTVGNSQTENTLTFTLRNHEDLKYIKLGALVVFRDLDKNYQVFEITNISEDHKEVYEMQVTCTNQFVELGDEYIGYKTTITAPVPTAAAQMLNGTRWQVGRIDANLGTHQFTFGRQYVLKALAHLVTVADCELIFRVTISGQSITGRYVDIVAKRGSDLGKRFVYGKDATRIYKETSDDDLKTAVYAYGKYDNQNDSIVTIATAVWRGSPWDSKPAAKPSGQLWVGDEAAKNLYGRTGGRHRFGEYFNDEITDPDTLLNEAWDYLQTINAPKVSYEMEAVELERITGLDHERVRMGDTVAVIDPDFSPALRVKARVLQIDRDLMDPTKTKFVVGNYIPSVITRVG